MNEQELKTFEEIKKKAEADKEMWNKAQEDESVTISPEKEDEIMERMFLVFYTEQYLIAQKRIQELEKKLAKTAII